MTVDGSESASTFKHLFSNTYYSFAVTAVNNAGEGLQHISPKKERTETGKSKNRCFLLLNNHCLLSPAPSSPPPTLIHPTPPSWCSSPSYSPHTPALDAYLFIFVLYLNLKQNIVYVCMYVFPLVLLPTPSLLLFSPTPTLFSFPHPLLLPLCHPHLPHPLLLSPSFQ